MIDYGKLLNTAYSITIRNPLLWVFGLFVIGSFNLNFLRFQESWPVGMPEVGTLMDWLEYFRQNPLWLGMTSFVVLFVSVAGLLITNWSRIMLILSVRSLFQTQRLEIKQSAKESRAVLWPVIQVSLITTMLMVVVAAGLLLPPFLLENSQLQPLLWLLGLLIFLPLAFTISCINIFTTFFLVLFKRGVWTAFNVGTDLFVSRWTSVLGLTAVLMVIYSGVFVAGVSLIYLLKLFLGTVLVALPIGETVVSAALVFIRVAAGFTGWVLLAGLSVFFNTSLLLLFFELITPIKAEHEKSSDLAPAHAGIV